MKRRGFEIVKGYEDKGINLPTRKTAHSAGYDVEAAEDVVIPMYKPGIKPTLIPTGLKGYCMDDECFLLLNRSSGPKKGFLMANSVGLIDSDYYGNPTNKGEIIIALRNTSKDKVILKPGERVIQGIFVPYFLTDEDESELETAKYKERQGGIGSTNKEQYDA